MCRRAAVTAGRMLIVDCHETRGGHPAAQLRARGRHSDHHRRREGPARHRATCCTQIDAIIAAQDFPSALTGHEDLGRALEAIGREFGRRLVCVTLGAGGQSAWCDGREIRTPAFAVDCVDTTGAGDVFRGGFRRRLPARAGRRRSRTCWPTPTPSRRSTAGRWAPGAALPDAGRGRAACCQRRTPGVTFRRVQRSNGL